MLSKFRCQTIQSQLRDLCNRLEIQATAIHDPQDKKDIQDEILEVDTSIQAIIGYVEDHFGNTK